MYEFSGAGICPNPNTSVTSQPLDAIFSIYSSQGNNCSSANDVYNTNGWNTTSTINLSEYNEFSIITNECFNLNLISITFSHRVSNVTSIPTWHLRSSIDGFLSDVSSGTSSVVLTPTMINLPITFVNLRNITFRFYITSATASTTTWRNDQVEITGSINPIVPDIYYADLDGDSFGDPFNFISACSSQIGYVLNNQDCDDTKSGINPNTLWFEDYDNDSYGNPSIQIIACSSSLNFVLDNTDCNDSNSVIQNAVDVFYLDYDLDGFGDPSNTLISCDQPEGYVSNQLDCDDLNNLITVASKVFYQDFDFDGFGNSQISEITCFQTDGYCLDSTDCDDTNPMIYPNALDNNDNEIDENCDGVDGILALSQLYFDELKINISDNLLKITLNVPTDKLFIQLINLEGKLVFTSSKFSNFDISTLKSGIYILHIETNSELINQRIFLSKDFQSLN